MQFLSLRALVVRRRTDIALSHGFRIRQPLTQCARSCTLHAMDAAFVIKGRTEQIIEATYGKPLPDVLRSLYHDQGLSQQAVADKLEVHRASVGRWMKLYGIATRDRRALAGNAA